MVDPRYGITQRENEAREQIRKDQDPRNQRIQATYYPSHHTHWLKLLIATGAGLAVIAFIGFIVFNLLFS